MKQNLLTIFLSCLVYISYCQPTFQTATSGITTNTVNGNVTTGQFRLITGSDGPSVVLYGPSFEYVADLRSNVQINGALFKPNGALALGNLKVPANYLLAIKGKMICEEVQVKLSADWPDYVFARDYKLKPLSEVEFYVNKYKHLPEIPSAAEVEKDGFAVGEMNEKLLKKVEELTLYLIDQDKKIKELELRLTLAEKK